MMIYKWGPAFPSSWDLFSMSFKKRAASGLFLLQDNFTFCFPDMCIDNSLNKCLLN